MFNKSSGFSLLVPDDANIGSCPSLKHWYFRVFSAILTFFLVLEIFLSLILTWSRTVYTFFMTNVADWWSPESWPPWPVLGLFEFISCFLFTQLSQDAATDVCRSCRVSLYILNLSQSCTSTCEAVLSIMSHCLFYTSPVFSLWLLKHTQAQVRLQNIHPSFHLMLYSHSSLVIYDLKLIWCWWGRRESADTLGTDKWQNFKYRYIIWQ